MTEFDPRWMSSTVNDLLLLIYQNSDHERMPILADAIMDAGCDDEALINFLRSPHDWYDYLWWFTAHWLDGNEYAQPPDAPDILNSLCRWAHHPEAIATVRQWAETVGGPAYYDDNYEVGPDKPSMKVSEMLQAARDYLRRDDYKHMGTNENYKDLWDQMGEFWTAYETLTGEQVKDKTDSFFSCSC